MLEPRGVFRRSLHSMDRTILTVSSENIVSKRGVPVCSLAQGCAPPDFYFTDNQVKKVIKALQDYLSYRKGKK